jgi:two-component system, OmpR family, alkaline phosphatase synthesis response regulator PhoP
MLALHTQTKSVDMPRILVVEDEADLRLLVDRGLSSLPAKVTQASDGAQGLEFATQNKFDLLVLDVNLPKLNGFNLCRQLRAKEIYTPVLFLTAMRSEFDQVLGLQLGADDYVTKPFSLLPLQARVRALLRREQFMLATQLKNENLVSTQSKNTLIFGELCIEDAKMQASMGGRDLNLTPKEWGILWVMASAPGVLFSREQLLQRVWGNAYDGFEHTVNSHINRLRAKLTEADPDRIYIHTAWGSGYRFECPQL